MSNPYEDASLTPEEGQAHQRDAQLALRMGPRAYTREQAAFIEAAVVSRQPLKTPHLPPVASAESGL